MPRNFIGPGVVSVPDTLIIGPADDDRERFHSRRLNIDDTSSSEFDDTTTD
jgi:hypothetical protein